MPPWMAGWSVFTRPSMISGNPVTSDTCVTGMPASAKNLNVPPVEMSWTPRSTNPRANGSRFHLLETDTSARRTFTASPLSPDDLRDPIVVHLHQARTRRGRTDLSQREQLDHAREHPVLQRVDARRQSGRRVVIVDRQWLLLDERTRVHARV